MEVLVKFASTRVRGVPDPVDVVRDQLLHDANDDNGAEARDDPHNGEGLQRPLALKESLRA